MKTNKKGFTLIELITVIAILGILVLLAAPKFLGYAEKANIVKIQSGIKAVSTATNLKSLENPEFTKDWVVLTPEKLQEINDSGKLIDKNGFIKENLDGGKNVPLKDLDNVKWNSGGEFILSEDEESVYYYNKDMTVSKNPDGSATVPGDNNGEGSDNGDNNGGNETNPPEEPKEPEITYPIELPNGDLEHQDGTITTPDGQGIRQPDGSAIYPNGDIKDKDGTITKPDGTIIEPDLTTVKPDGSVVLPDGTVVPLASSSEFTWIPEEVIPGVTTIPGYYKYTGSKTALVIPNSIDGKQLTSYRTMFSNTNVKTVVSRNKNVTDMFGMFQNSQATSLNLIKLDTSNVEEMGGMFNNSKATSLNIKNFDTSKVTNMSSMFSGSSLTSIDLSHFKTYNVTKMDGMFNGVKINGELNLSSFSTANVTSMSRMFDSFEATSLNVTSFNTSKVTNMYGMFFKSKFSTLDLSSFDMSNVSDSDVMFYQATATVGYAKTSSDATKLNASSNKPSTLTFKTK